MPLYFPPSLRTPLTQNTTFYVSNSGNNSNTGTSAGSPWQTIQYAINFVQRYVDTFGYTVTIQVADGTYSENVSAASPFVGGGSVILQGNTTTPANCIISPASGIAFAASNGAIISTGGFDYRVAGTNANTCIQSFGGGTTISLVSPIRFGGANPAFAQLYAQVGGTINGSANITFAVGATNGIYALYTGSNINITGITMTFSGTPNYTNFINAFQGTVAVPNNTISGAIGTGSQGTAQFNGVCNGASTTLSGTAFTTSTGGQKI